MSAFLERTHFQIPRMSEYFDEKELVAQTGQPSSQFGSVILKELIDNALDAVEVGNMDPEISVTYAESEEGLGLSVLDNGTGILPETVNKILNYDTRTSDKNAYRSPTRGAQGNALKTVIGIPFATGGGKVEIIAKGIRHEIMPYVDNSDQVQIEHIKKPYPRVSGTQVIVTLKKKLAMDASLWALSAALFNPHVSVKFGHFEKGELPCSLELDSAKTIDFYKKTRDSFKKIYPCDPTSIHWYDASAFQKLVCLQSQQNDLPLREFIRQFRGLTGTQKAKAIGDRLGCRRVSDVQDVDLLFHAMRNASTPAKPGTLGAIGEDHFNTILKCDPSWYKKAVGDINGLPFLFEIFVGQAEGKSGIFYGINHATAFGDFLTSTHLHHQKMSGFGV